MKYRRAAGPTPEQIREREESKAAECEAARAEPARPDERLNHKCAGQIYKVTSDRVVHERRKGETVELCPHKGATHALVTGGHLVPVHVTPAATVKADDKKEADHG